MPKLGQTVTVTETDPNSDTDVESVALVTHVYSEADADGDTKWWDAVKDKGVVDLLVLHRDGSTSTIRGASKAETYTDDEGRERQRHGTYSDGNSTSDSGSVTTPDVPQSADPQTANDQPGWTSTLAPGQQG